MTNQEIATEARKIFDTQIEAETDKDRIAKLELLREYITNPDFRVKLEQYTWEQNK